MEPASVDHLPEKRLTNVQEVAESRFRNRQEELAYERPAKQEQLLDSELSPLGRASRRLERCKDALRRQVKERCAIQNAVAREYKCPEMLSKDELDRLEEQMNAWVANSVLGLQQCNSNEFFAAGTVSPSAAAAAQDRVAHEIPAQIVSVINAELGVLRAEGKILGAGWEQDRSAASKQPPSIPSVKGHGRKRGPKPDYESAARVAEIVTRVAPDGVLRSRLDEVCEALDQAEIPCPPIWRSRYKAKCWSDYPEKSTAVKAIEGRLELAKQKPKQP